jgi:predicted acetyltransferase
VFVKEVLTLPTEREGLILRELATKADDFAYLEAINEDREHVDQYCNAVAKKYKCIADVTRARLEAGDKIRMGIWNVKTFVGTVNADPNEDKTETEIGYWLRASAVGNGYATLAVKSLVAHVSPMFPRVFAEVHVDNQKSANVLERSGFQTTDIVERSWGHAIVFELIK